MCSSDLGWKYNEWEMKGVPLRVEIGPRDIKNQQITIVRRDTGEKSTLPSSSAVSKLTQLLEEIQQNLFDRARKSVRQLTNKARDMESLGRILQEKGGFVEAYLCDDVTCEDKIKEETGATVRLVPFEAKDKGNCVYCGDGDSKTVFLARSY